MKRPAVFFDRDNTLIACDGYLGDPAKVELIDGAAEAIVRVRDLGFATVVFSNQSGVARGMFGEEAVHAVNHRLDDLLHEDDPRATIDRHDFCPFHPTAKVGRYRLDSELRKPKPGMIYQAAAALNLDLRRSWVIGDAPRDIAAGHAAGLRTVLLKIEGLPPSPATNEGAGVEPDYVAKSLIEAAEYIARATRAGDGVGLNGVSAQDHGIADEHSLSHEPAATPTEAVATEAAPAGPAEAPETTGTPPVAEPPVALAEPVPEGSADIPAPVVNDARSEGGVATIQPAETPSTPVEPATPVDSLTPVEPPADPVEPTAAAGTEPAVPQAEPVVPNVESALVEFVAEPLSQPEPTPESAVGEGAEGAEPAFPAVESDANSGKTASVAGTSEQPEPAAEPAAITSPTSPDRTDEEPVKLTPRPHMKIEPARGEPVVQGEPVKPTDGAAEPAKPKQGGFVVKPNQAPRQLTWGERMRHAKDTPVSANPSAGGGPVIKPGTPATFAPAPTPAASPLPAAAPVDIPDADEDVDDVPAGAEVPRVGPEPVVASRAAVDERVDAEALPATPATPATTPEVVVAKSDAPIESRGLATAAIDATRATEPTRVAVERSPVDRSAVAAEPIRGARREDVVVEAATADEIDDAAAASVPAVRARTGAPSDGSRTEELLEQILQELRRREEQGSLDFSVSKLLAGITQVLALAAMFFAYLNKDTQNLEPTLLLALTLQTLTISLLIMGKQK